MIITLQTVIIIIAILHEFILASIQVTVIAIAMYRFEILCRSSIERTLNWIFLFSRFLNFNFLLKQQFQFSFSNVSHSQDRRNYCLKNNYWINGNFASHFLH